ncbi:MAG: Rne/Rng family ribonuclease [Pseudomonadota bacterium]
MAKKMLIDAAHAEEVRVCVTENGKVDDFDFEASARKPLRGNIYLARVTRVEPSLQAAFVEFGGNRHGFLAFNEIHPDYYQIPVSDRQALQAAEAEEARLAAELDLMQRGDDDESDDDGPEDDGSDGADQTSAAGDVDQDESDADASDETLKAAGDDRASADSDDDAGQDTTDGDEDADASPGGPQTAAAFLASPVETISEDTSGGDREGVDEAEANDEEHAVDAASDENAGALDDDESVDEDPVDEGPSAHAEKEDGEPEDIDALEAEAADADAADSDVKSKGEREALYEQYKEAKRQRARILRNYKIQEVIKRRQILLVQVVKEERGNKGAALTTYMSLAGRYCVLMPNTARGGGISRKIAAVSDRKRLRRVVDSLDVSTGMGLIIRTAGAKRTKIEIKRDYDYLTRLWENIRSLTLESIAPCLIYEEASLIKRAIRDLYDKDISMIMVEGEDGYREAKDFMKMLMPSHAKNVQPYKEKSPIFTRYDVEQQLDAMYQPIVRLKSGGYIVINQTEALVAIDVNSGKATRERNIELTALKTNQEAAAETARQCRLRDLAGLIVIDFIDMDENKNNRSVERKLKDALKQDRARIQVGRISSFGLLEMSRQRRRSGIVDGTTQPCPTCNGAGVIRSSEMASLRILRAAESEAISGRAGGLNVSASMDVALFILNYKREWLREIESVHGVRIEVTADPTKLGDQYELTKTGAALEKTSQQNIVRADTVDAPTEDEPREPSKAVSSESDDATGDADDERPARKRRRRRRRRRDGEDSASADAEARADDSDASALDEDRRVYSENGDAENGDPESGDNDQRTDAGDAVSESDTSDAAASVDGDGEGSEDGEPRRRRRRGRRGGRRKARRTDAEATAETSAETPVETGADPSVDAAANGEDRDTQHKPASSNQEAATQSPEAGGHDDDVRQGRSRAVEVSAENVANNMSMDEPAAVASNSEGNGHADQTASNAQDEADAAPPPSDAPTAEEIEERVKKRKTQRRGWWSRALGG